MTNEEARQLASTMAEGFKEVGRQVTGLDEKLTKIEKEREFEKGQEIKKRVDTQADDIKALNDWKIEVDPILKNLRRVVWGLGAAVGTALLSGLVGLIVYALQKVADK